MSIPDLIGACVLIVLTIAAAVLIAAAASKVMYPTHKERHDG